LYKLKKFTQVLFLFIHSMAVLWLQEEEVHEDLAEDQEEDLLENRDVDLLEDQKEDPVERVLVVKLLDVHELSLTNEKAN